MNKPTETVDYFAALTVKFQRQTSRGIEVQESHAYRAVTLPVADVVTRYGLLELMLSEILGTSYNRDRGWTTSDLIVTHFTCGRNEL